MELEISFQLKDLSLLDLQRPGENCLLVGAGDSYAACLAAQYASSNKALCCYPLDLAENHLLAKGRTVYFVSVSGKTKTNIEAVRVARSKGIRTVAVTSDPASPLAAACSQVIRLNHRRAQVSTAGTVSFAASLITCISLTTRVTVPKNLKTVLSTAEKQAETIVRQGRFRDKSCFMLGNGIFYPIAMYGAMKLNEVMGANVSAYPTEAFCHSPLFGIEKTVPIVILGHRPDEGKMFARRLEKAGFNSCFVEVTAEGLMQKLLHATFFVQLLALKTAQKAGRQDCYYLQNKELLNISSDFIY